MKKTWIPAILALVLGAAAGQAIAENEVVLLEDGKATCTIVTGRDDRLALVLTNKFRSTAGTKPANVLAEAADDLAEHLNTIGRITFHPQLHRAGLVRVVQNLDEATSKYRILLGTAAIEQYDLQEEADQLSYAGYIYRTVGADLLIFGASSKGTANGIYGFLQDELGVRWFGPHELFTVVPQMEAWIADREGTPPPKVRFENLDKKVEPSFYGRNGGGNRPETQFQHENWARRMRQGDGRQPFDRASHHLWRMFPPSRYFENNPEYYYLRGGQRRVYEPRHFNWNLCWSNPEVIDIAANAAAAYFRGGRFNDSFSLGINDTDAYCECPECAKLQPERDFRGGRVASDMYYHFVNEVARRVKEEFPGRYIGAIAYNDVTAPPLGAMEDNVFVVLVNDVSQHFDQAYRQTDDELVAAWEKKGIVLGMYYYVNQGGFVPAYFARHLAAELKDKHSRGFRVLFNESNIGAVCSPLGYVDYRLWWDVTLDVDELLDEYFSSLYGPAAAYMAELYELLEEIHLRPRRGGFLYEYNKFPQFRPYTGEDLEKIRDLLAAAHSAVEGMGVGFSGWDLPVERRLAYTSRRMRVFLNMLTGLVLARELENLDGELDDIEVLRRLDKIERLNTIVDGNDALFRELLIVDENAAGTQRNALHSTRIRLEWRAYLAQVSGEALAAIYRQVRMQDELGFDARTKTRVGSVASVFSADDVQAALLSYRTGELKPGRNLIINPSFEKLSETPSVPSPEVLDRRDWGPSKLHGWAVYPPGQRADGEFDVSAEHKRTGDQSAVLRGTGTGLYLTVVEDVAPGDIYHVEAHIKNTAHVTRIDVPVVSLHVRWLDHSYDWTAQSFAASVETAQLDEWMKLEQIVRIPETARKAVVWVSANSLQGHEEVFIDDVSFRLLKKEAENI